ncbi:MAG: VWA domain-containing protein [Myxococcota bacterium]
MRRPTRTIVALATPLLVLLAFGCKKSAAPGTMPPSDMSYEDADYPAYEESTKTAYDYDYDYEDDAGEAAEYDADDGADIALASEAPEPMARSAERNVVALDSRSSRRRDRRSARKDRRSRNKAKNRAMAEAPASPSSPSAAGAYVTDSSATAVAPVAVAPMPTPTHNTEGYDHIQENDFIAVADDPRSTFSIDVDTASYSNMRRFIRDGQLPPADAVRIEELVNYFDYDYAQPTGDDPFSVTTEVAPCPWAPDHRLVHVGLQGKDVSAKAVPPRNLVFLLDVSGSMSSHDKLPLLKRGLGMLADQLRPQDRVSIVVYAGASGVVLDPTSDRAEIKHALGRLDAGGSTNGGAGIELAYELANRNFKKGGINRVILATDGDFNVGVTSQGDLIRLIESKRESGVFLSVLGFGTGNLQDSTMEQLADKGNGNYAYIDSATEAHKVLVEQAGATLMTIAKDVKIQVEFNPVEVSSYRLVGYENRALAHRDFNDDTKDAGEIGAGHTVTALYEVVPTGRGVAPEVDPLKYQDSPTVAAAADSGELMTVKLRYKKPAGSRSKLLSVAIEDDDGSVADSSADFRFSAAVAEMGLLLRNSKWRGQATWAQAYELASSAQGHDPAGRRAEFKNLIRQAAELSGGSIRSAQRDAKIAR